MSKMGAVQRLLFRDSFPGQRGSSSAVTDLAADVFDFGRRYQSTIYGIISPAGGDEYPSWVRIIGLLGKPNPGNDEMQRRHNDEDGLPADEKSLARFLQRLSSRFVGVRARDLN